MVENKSSYNSRKHGNEYEKIAAKYLKNKGYKIIKINFYCKMGEIDIIASKDEFLVFIEVKYRKNRQTGSAAEAVTFSKMRKICRTADYYMLINNFYSNASVRFDVIAIEEGHLKHYENAFEYIS